MDKHITSGITFKKTKVSNASPKDEGIILKRYECPKCKAHILGQLFFCSVCSERRDPLIPPIAPKIVQLN